MSSNPNSASPVTNAWRLQREHKASSAVADYEKIVTQDSNDIDALYGYGLALRDNGQKEAAVANFKKALELVESAAAARRPANTSEEDVLVANTPEDDRNMMLTRMIKQRLSELGV